MNERTRKKLNNVNVQLKRVETYLEKLLREEKLTRAEAVNVLSATRLTLSVRDHLTEAVKRQEESS